MRLVLSLLLLAASLPARAGDAPPPDPLAVLISQLSAPLDDAASAAPGASAENSPRLAQIQASLTVAAAGYESLRSPVHAAAAKELLAAQMDPALKPFVKDRDASLDAVYRTLAVVDYTWALRFPGATCAATDRRRALLQSSDGLFVDPDVGTLSPWMARLLGPNSFGKAPEEALDRASEATTLTQVAYEKLRVQASKLTEELSGGQADPSKRAGLYCERAEIYEKLASAHRKSGPTLASLSTGKDDIAAESRSVFLLATVKGNDYVVLGAGFLVRTANGVKFVTDASIARGHEKIYAFAHPASDGKLGDPIPVVIERISDGIGPAVGRIDCEGTAPALSLADASPAKDELVRGLGPLRLAGPWTETQGLVTETGSTTFQSDAALSAEMAGSPVLNDRGEVAGLMIRRGEDVTTLRAEKLRAFLDGKPADTSGAEFVASRNSGSASLLTTARPVDEYAWSAPGASAIESGLPTNLGGVSWEGGGGVGGFGPSGYAGPPSGYSSGFAPRSSGYSDGGSAERIGNDLGSALGDAAGKLMVYGMQKLFQGIYSLFHPQPSRTQDVVVRHKKAAPPPPPPPPPEPKITGLALSAIPPDAAPGQQVTLVAQLLFQGDYKQKSNITISFSAGGDKAYFGTQGNKQQSATGQTDAGGRATALLTLEESVALNSENEFNDLDREKPRQDGQDSTPVAHIASTDANETPTRKVKDHASSELSAIDAEGSSDEPGTEPEEQTKPQGAVTEAAAAIPGNSSPSGAAAARSTMPNLEPIRVKAAYSNFSDSKTIVPKVENSPGQPPDCVEQLKRLYPLQQIAQQQRQSSTAILLPILSKYDIDYDEFQAEFPKLLSLTVTDACDLNAGTCKLRANADDWAAASAAYGQVQALDKEILLRSVAIGKQSDLCADIVSNKKSPDKDRDDRSSDSRNSEDDSTKGPSSPGREIRTVGDIERFNAYADEDSWTHILEGEENGQGGHRAGTGNPGKSEFPATWDDAKIKENILSVATDPKSSAKLQTNGRYLLSGTRDGVNIKVVVEGPSQPDYGRVVTAYPTSTARNPR